MTLQSILSQFQFYLDQEIETRKQKLPYACCLSTIGIDGFPNSRFVSLKEITNEQFIISGTLSARKGEELAQNNKAALTFWLPETQVQIRIQGETHRIEDSIADTYFKQRNIESQIVSIVSDQGKFLRNPEILNTKYDSYTQYLESQTSLPRPGNWGAFGIAPIRIEFLIFKETRFHDRILYQKESDIWTKILLQP
ncbi:pyridoxine/pyridoxamine 5'-phosphate oxidase [Sphingobacterium yanglingense]|uniref:Pyridoxamine 5'-phosphate oxidase n=1 Tax=Sphingobacterium yanglingense TaxID=1437280 RepID=A0A4R6WIW1_9SPHI|nr:pyridoxal 5'-phosphate synthase [Sphingobacterium yanglingense]TDQ77894.1 pyridoxamine 5'-phosphate oxidase [Sphingobacterium yanglingense]